MKFRNIYFDGINSHKSILFLFIHLKFNIKNKLYELSANIITGNRRSIYRNKKRKVYMIKAVYMIRTLMFYENK